MIVENMDFFSSFGNATLTALYAEYSRVDAAYVTTAPGLPTYSVLDAQRRTLREAIDSTPPATFGEVLLKLEDAAATSHDEDTAEVVRAMVAILPAMARPAGAGVH